MAFEIHPWKIKENSLENIRFAESLCSTGNGYMGLRGTFEEDFTGDTHQGQYIGGVWFPDKTRVGWWKNGYPQYFGKAINCVNLIGIHVNIDGKALDLHDSKIIAFERILDMQTAVFSRKFTVQNEKGRLTVNAERFVSLAQKELLAISYTIESNYDANIQLLPYLDANVKNLDSNYDEHFWLPIDETAKNVSVGLLTQTKENPFGAPRFTVAATMQCKCKQLEYKENKLQKGYVEQCFEGKLSVANPVTLYKYTTVVTDRDYPQNELIEKSFAILDNCAEKSYETLKAEHIKQWAKRWDKCDVIIEGDTAAQQGIRFNLFHLLSTYSGDDARLNIGPKGFTGEKYGGATYWDTEAYCLPVYMSIAGETVAKQLLHYRFMQLPQAYVNAQAQGLQGALYPMVTFTGLECHNEWEITFEELHRNAAIAYAIYNYSTYTGNTEYLLNDGFDVLCGIARFWKDRVHYSANKQQYMIHGVTGPNEYENNVNNNWYTNRIASWCLEYFVETAKKVSPKKLEQHNITPCELDKMMDIVQKMYYPTNDELGIFVQHDTFLDKELMPASAIPQAERPINQHWSWDRVLRSCFIKQADVLQGIYFLNHLYSNECIQKNFDFYEPMTVHESSLSPCVHSILAAQIGYQDKAVEMYLRTARLDLDNINNDTDDGLHITSMAGSWLSMVQGFAGMRTINQLSFAPFLPDCWNSYSFKIEYRKRILQIKVDKQNTTITLLQGEPIEIVIHKQNYKLLDSITVAHS
ncbi:MAG: family 65 glycosyl hydrolase domain-containing protein [Eubacteriales bacterium]|nr:family 65 glycosyl hydrolase domain-containing protein [Eubacteriales bacterium]